MHTSCCVFVCCVRAVRESPPRQTMPHPSTRGEFPFQKVNRDVRPEVFTGILAQLCPPPPPGYVSAAVCAEETWEYWEIRPRRKRAGRVAGEGELRESNGSFM